MSADTESRTPSTDEEEAEEHWATDDRYATNRRVWGRAWDWLPWTDRGRSRGDGAAGAVGETSEDDGGFLGGRWTAALIVGGAVLFVIPEPTTSVVGVLMLLLGGVAWFVDWAT